LIPRKVLFRPGCGRRLYFYTHLDRSGHGKLLLNGGSHDLPRLATARDAEAGRTWFDAVFTRRTLYRHGFAATNSLLPPASTKPISAPCRGMYPAIRALRREVALL